jgi:uncharacterized membrane protein
VTAARSWSVAKIALPVAAMAAGAAIGWRLTAGVTAIAVMAVPLGAANGYSKSYSP